MAGRPKLNPSAPDLLPDVESPNGGGPAERQFALAEATFAGVAPGVASSASMRSRSLSKPVRSSPSSTRPRGSRMRSGSTGEPLTRISKWRCGPVDPLRIRLPRGRVLEGELLGGFERERERIDALLATPGQTPAKVASATAQ